MDARDIGVRKHAVLWTAMRGHDGGETVSLHSSRPDLKPSLVMAGLVPAIHDFACFKIVREDVDARHKAGHDGGEAVRFNSSWPGSSRPSTSLVF